MPVLSAAPEIGVARPGQTALAAEFDRRQQCYVWFDRANDQANPGWCLRTWNRDGELFDWPLDADDPDDVAEAVAEAGRYV